MLNGAECGTGAPPLELTDHFDALLGLIDNLAKVFTLDWPMADAHNFKVNGAAMQASVGPDSGVGGDAGNGYFFQHKRLVIFKCT